MHYIQLKDFVKQKIGGRCPIAQVSLSLPLVEISYRNSLEALRFQSAESPKTLMAECIGSNGSRAIRPYWGRPLATMPCRFS
jgi:hypothetical protein